MITLRIRKSLEVPNRFALRLDPGGDTDPRESSENGIIELIDAISVEIDVIRDIRSFGEFLSK